MCKSCNKRFLEFYSYKACHKNINSKIIQLTKEGLGIRSTARVLNISTTTLLRRIIKIAADITQPKSAIINLTNLMK
ncbi:IS1-like element transposase [Chryseobacterium sp.]|uniref:IS1-like element transposase n=1 Tax=Chryseobacterium sp. TaxID=1871047 RepID=UPI0026104D78|nr:IS1-like element transposase [Chryseobacterium sp.]